MQKPSLIIIGAGASGLMAAHLLADKMQVTIVEAAKEIGGRIHTVKSGKRIIETGAEFIHGDLPLTFSLLKEAGIKAKAVKGNMYRHRNGKFIEEEEMIEGWHKLMKEMKTLKKDIPLKAFLQKHFPAKKYKQFREGAISYAEGFDLADASKASVQALYNEWSHEDQNNYRIPTGYFSLLNYFLASAKKKGCILYTNTTVKKIEWENNTVSVFCNGNKKYSAGKLLITVPIPVLAEKNNPAFIQFSPALPAIHKAAKEIGFGHVIKIILEFKKPFWKRDTGFVISEEIFPTWWTQLPDKSAVITGWLGGPSAKKLAALSGAQLLSKALASLAAIYLIPVKTLKAELLNSHVCNWQKNKIIPGGYSYATPASAAAKKILCTPVADMIFFAGEALYEGKSPGTVEAALVTGKNAAEKIASEKG